MTSLALAVSGGDIKIAYVTISDGPTVCLGAVCPVK